MNRRDWLVASAAISGSALTMRFQRKKYSRDFRPKISRVATLLADEYSDKLDQLVFDCLRLFHLDVRGKSVLLKPNIVECIPGKPVNTDAQLIGAAAEAFLRLDAASVIVGEGPGHHRDTDLLLYETGLGDQLAQRKIAFVDLNRDGTLNGSSRYLKTVVLADDPVAADSTLTRFMGIRPERVAHIREAGRFIGNLHQSVISELM